MATESTRSSTIVHIPTTCGHCSMDADSEQFLANIRKYNCALSLSRQSRWNRKDISHQPHTVIHPGSGKDCACDSAKWHCCDTPDGWSNTPVNVQDSTHYTPRQHSQHRKVLRSLTSSMTAAIIVVEAPMTPTLRTRESTVRYATSGGVDAAIGGIPSLMCGVFRQIQTNGSEKKI